MPIIASRIPNEPIIIVKYSNPPEPVETGALTTSQQVSALMKDIEGLVYRINDIREYNMHFSDMVVGMAEETKGGLPGTLSDPRLRVVTVGSSELVRLGSEAAKQAQYGAIDIQLYTTMDEALAYVRAEIAKKSGSA